MSETVENMKRMQAIARGDYMSYNQLFQCYYQPLCQYVYSLLEDKDDAEDVVQEVLVKLVDILRNGRFEIERGTKFRSFLATLIRNQLADHYRREQVRGAGRRVPLKDWSASVEPEAAARLDVEWRLARHRAALDHVLTKTALAKQSKEIYADYVLRELPIEEVAEKYGVSRNLVSQIKSRVDRMVAAVEAEYED